jgi:hypothetical protein
LLIRGSHFALNTNFSNFPKVKNAVTAEAERKQGRTLLMEAISSSELPATVELIAHVVEEDLPYSEILTADYMMMNKILNEFLDGTAVFSDDDPANLFKPSRIQGYYTGNQLEAVGEIIQGNFTYTQVKQGEKPLIPYPHAGVLSNLSFLNRYPTTATNRNRARARWTLYHFLDIDVEKSTQRPTDQAALIDKNNPTMNNTNCSVCHSVLDPVAGAFQNWGGPIANYYRQFNGMDVLDYYYKYHSDSGYVEGDTWYRDMRVPGLFDSKIQDQDYSLSELASKIVEEKGFYTSAIKFWWPAIFGEEALNKPTFTADISYQSRITAYNLQQELISNLGAELNRTGNLKLALLGMIKSSIFRAEIISNNDFSIENPAFVASIGNLQLLNVNQIRNKTDSLTGIILGRRLQLPPGYDSCCQKKINDRIGSYWSILNDHNSLTIKKRSELTSPAFIKAIQIYAKDLACNVVGLEFYIEDKEDRKLFKYVDLSNTPEDSEVLIKKQIAFLFEKFLGISIEDDNEELIDVYNLFNNIYMKRKTENFNYGCNFTLDSVALKNLGIDKNSFATLKQENDSWFYDYNWDWVNSNTIPQLNSDYFKTKEPWFAVVYYLLTDFKYIYE